MAVRQALTCGAAAVLFMGVFAAAAVWTAAASAMPPGTANFSAPTYAPDYFSNESGPFRGGAAATQPPPAPMIAAPAPQPVAVAPAQQYVVMRPAPQRIFIARRGADRHAARTTRTASHRRAAQRRPLTHAHARHMGAARQPTATASRYLVKTVAMAKNVPKKAVAAHGRGAPQKEKRIARVHG